MSITFVVAVGGESSRIRDFMDRMNLQSGFPKHLLRAGRHGASSLVQVNIDNIKKEFPDSDVILYASEHNFSFFSGIKNARVLVDTDMRGHLYPMFKTLIDKDFSENTIFGFDGDIFCPSFNWGKFVRFHSGHNDLYTVGLQRSLRGVRTKDTAVVIDDCNHGKVLGRSHKYAGVDSLYSTGIYGLRRGESILRIAEEILGKPPFILTSQMIFKIMLSRGQTIRGFRDSSMGINVNNEEDLSVAINQCRILSIVNKPSNFKLNNLLYLRYN